MLRTIRSNFNTPDGSPPWSVECGLCNVIAGPTASGKTTIVHAIEYGTTGLVNDVHGRNALKQVGRVGMLTGNKKLVNELLDERGQPYKGVCLSDAVREALTSESKGATEFFASYLPDPYKGWFEGLAEQQQAFLQKRGLEKSSLEGVLKALDDLLSSTRSKIKDAEIQIAAFAGSTRMGAGEKAALAEELRSLEEQGRPVQVDMRARDSLVAKVTRFKSEEAARVKRLAESVEKAAELALEKTAVEAELQALEDEPVEAPSDEIRAARDAYAQMAGALEILSGASDKHKINCVLCGTKDVNLDNDKLARRQAVLVAWSEARYASSRAWEQWDAKCIAARNRLHAISQESYLLGTSIRMLRATDNIAELRDVENRLAEMDKRVALAQEQAAAYEPRLRRMNEIRALLQEDERLGKVAAQVASARALKETNERLEDEIVRLRASLDEAKKDGFAKSKGALLAEIGERMGPLPNALGFEVDFRVSPIFAVEVTKPASRMGVPSGFTKLRIDVAVALTICPSGQSVVLPPDRQTTLPEFLPWIQSVGAACKDLASQGRIVQVFVQTTLLVTADLLGPDVNLILPPFLKR
jgi:hypothetical protein